MAVEKFSGLPGEGMSFRARNFKGAFWRGLGYRAARAAWAACAALGLVFLVLVGLAVVGHYQGHHTALRAIQRLR